MISGVWLVWVRSSAGLGWFFFATGVRHVSSVCFFFCYRGETCELCLVLAIGVRHVSFVWSSYRGETCKPVALGYRWVTELQCHA
jgi:hypothetical protein